MGFIAIETIRTEGPHSSRRQGGGGIMMKGTVVVLVVLSIVAAARMDMNAVYPRKKWLLILMSESVGPWKIRARFRIGASSRQQTSRKQAAIGPVFAQHPWTEGCTSTDGPPPSSRYISTPVPAWLFDHLSWLSRS